MDTDIEVGGLLSPSIDTDITEAQDSVKRQIVEPLSIVSDLLVHNLTRSKKGVDPVLVKRSITFPALRYTESGEDMWPHESWAPAPVPEGKDFLEIELGEQISTGRIGLVHAVRIVRAREYVDGPEIPLDTIGITLELCVKVAKPYHCRSLAREAWMYEHLQAQDGYQGVAVPRCYGFFTVPLRDCSNKLGETLHSASHVQSWHEADIKLHSKDDRKPRGGDHLPSRDHLQDDTFSIRCAVDDYLGSKEKSSWNTWSHDPEAPLISFLLMERLGEPVSNDLPEAAEADLDSVMEDMAETGVLQLDLRWNNILSAREDDDDSVCPRHNVKHVWRLIDFDRALRVELPLLGRNRPMMKMRMNRQVPMTLNLNLTQNIEH
ncbi:hypothetical protein QCA50_016902 [Cerrena zonata]|uniref:Uncharacterized protein n=1 Tax=Cerrena zonata TaxID=2478898 RepID=A0AAW0FH90_9APHY